MKICVYPGSFDPVTLGHLDVINRAAAVFDRVIVAVLHNVNKHAAFPIEKRVEWLNRVTESIGKVDVVTHDGLLMDFMRANHYQTLVRGLRGATDFDAESATALYYDRLLPRVETVFFVTNPSLSYVSSSRVRELLAFDGSIDGLVPDAVTRDIVHTFNCR